MAKQKIAERIKELSSREAFFLFDLLGCDSRRELVGLLADWQKDAKDNDMDIQDYIHERLGGYFYYTTDVLELYTEHYLIVEEDTVDREQDIISQIMQALFYTAERLIFNIIGE